VLPVLQSLLDLQNLDNSLREKRALQASFPVRLAEVDARVARAHAALEQARADHLVALKDRKRFELDVDQWKERVRKYKDQTIQVKSNDAYRALLHEIQNAEAEIAKAEDRLLERMVAGEEYDHRIKSAEKTIQEEEARAGQDRAAIERDLSVVRQEIAALDARRQAALAGVPEDVLDEYHRIARHLHGVALAAVEHQACSMCGGRVRPHVFQEMLRESGEIFHCELCNRILYYVEPPASSESPAPAEAPASNHSA
jgi:uncharacterized protein